MTEGRGSYDPRSPGYGEILELLQQMEAKLTAAINAGLGAVNVAIASLADQHHKSLLDQERRNSSFADRDRVEDVARNVHAAMNNLTAVQLRVSQLERRCDHIESRLEEAGNRVVEGGFKLLGGAAGYLVLMLIAFGSAVLTYVLTHGGHP